MRLETTPPNLMLQITCEGLKNGGIRLGPASRSLTFRITSGQRMAAAPNTEQKTPNMSGPSNPSLIERSFVPLSRYFLRKSS
jgi:hypothetical protein